ncbi:MAG: DNA polymerase I, partial [Abditibacteriota bacterium]|nr:DNA polymerase I [Abditibacteriota bacterium]
MLLKLQEENFDCGIIAFDTGKPTFRHEEYKEYKAQRPPTPDDLRAQMPLSRDLAEAFGYTKLELDGFEGDDVIGTMARKAAAEGMETVIVTGDRDALQLVDENTKVMLTVKGVSETVLCDPEEVVNRFELTPAQIIDYKALKGDTSDNIPGVKGIGDVTATKLLKEYGTLENILASLDDMKKSKTVEKLRDGAEDAKLSKHLATIVTDMPIDVNPAECVLRPDVPALLGLFASLEFRKMSDRVKELFPAEKAPEPEAYNPGGYTVIETPEELKKVLAEAKAAGSCSFVFESDSPKPIYANIKAIAISLGAGKTYYISFAQKVAESLFDETEEPSFSLVDFADFAADESVEKICTDTKLAWGVFNREGYDLRGADFDTSIAFYLLQSDRASYDMFDYVFVAGADELDDRAKLCCRAELAFVMRKDMADKLAEAGMSDLFENIEMKLPPVLAEIELNGFYADSASLNALSVTFANEINALENLIYTAAGKNFNIASPKQLGKILFEDLGLPGGRKNKNGGYSTNADVLDGLKKRYPIAGWILRYRELSKLCSTYADVLPEMICRKTGRIHTSLNQTVTTTGRLSSMEPNLQNIPVRTELGRKIRGAFGAEEGNLLISADYSQIELRVMAHVTGDEGLTKAFARGDDIHAATAADIYEIPIELVDDDMRRAAKTVNFAVIYGRSDFMLANDLDISVYEAKDFKERYFDRFKGVKKYTEETVKSVKERGYAETLFGRRRYIPDINSSNGNIRQGAERQAVNMPIQGTAADIMKKAMIDASDALRDRFGGKAKLILQVHDELLVEAPKELAEEVAEVLRRSMESAVEMNVPLKVDTEIGERW